MKTEKQLTQIRGKNNISKYSLLSDIITCITRVYITKAKRRHQVSKFSLDGTVNPEFQNDNDQRHPCAVFLDSLFNKTKLIKIDHSQTHFKS